MSTVIDAAQDTLNLDVPCPRCNARAGERCRTASGRYLPRSHAARRTSQTSSEQLTRTQKEELVSILDAIEAAYRRHYIFASDHQATVLTLFTLENYCRDDTGQSIFSCLLFLYLRAKDTGAGKSALLRMIRMLTCDSFGPYVNPNSADLRWAASHGQLLILDEVTRWFNPDLQAILNVCNEPGNSVPRFIDGQWHEFPVFCPVVMAGRDDRRDLYDDTVRRSYVIDCKKEDFARVKTGRKWNAREFEESVAAPLRERISAWTRKALPAIRAEADKPMEDHGLADTLPDTVAYPFEPLYAIAQFAGRDWLQRVKAAASDIAADAVASDTVSDGHAFLNAVRSAMERPNPFLKFSDYSTGQRPKLSGRLNGPAFGWNARSEMPPCGSLYHADGRWELRIPAGDFPRIITDVLPRASGRVFEQRRVLSDLRHEGLLHTDKPDQHQASTRVWASDSKQRPAYRLDITHWFDNPEQEQEGGGDDA